VSCRKKQIIPAESAGMGVVSKKNLFCKIFCREVLIFIFTAVFFCLFSRFAIDPHHDGVMLIPALKVAAGEVVFLDVFCQYGVLVPLLQGAAVAVFGGELLVIRLLTVLFYAGSSVLLYKLWRRYLPEKVSYSVPVMFVLLASCNIVTFHSWNSVYSLFFMLLSGEFLLRYFEKHRWGKWNLCIAGIAAGLTWACRTPCGAVTVFAAILVIDGLNWFTGKKAGEIFRESACYAAGALSVAVLFTGYIWFSGAWTDFIKQSFGYVADFVYERGGGGSWQYFCESMFPFYQNGYWFSHTFFAVMPLGAMVMLYFTLRRGILSGRSEMQKLLPFAALLILGLGSWHQYYPVPCVRHLYWGGIPLFGAYLLMICRLFQNRKGIVKAVGAGLILIMLLGIVPRVIGMYIRLRPQGWQPREVVGVRHILLSQQDRRLVDVITEFNELDVVKSRGVMNWSELSLFSVMMPPCTFDDPQFYRFETAVYPDYDARVFMYIMQNKPAVLIDHDVFIPGYVLWKQSPYMGKMLRFLIPVAEE